MPKAPRLAMQCEHFHWTIFERKDVLYADGRKNKPNLGKHSLGTRDKRAAIENLKKLDHKLAVELELIESVVVPKPEVTLSLLDGWTRYLARAARPQVMKGVSESTQKRYRAVRDKHLLFCKKQGVQDWTQITRRHVEAYGEFLHREEYSDASIYLECTLLKQVTKYFVEEEKILPADSRIYLPLLRSEDSEAYCFTREQVREMIILCQADPSLNWLADVMIALAVTGMRIGELVALRWSDIDFVNNIISIPDNRFSAKAKVARAIRTTKGRRSRKVYLHQELRQKLEVLPRRSDGRVFSGEKGGTLDQRKVLLRLQRDVIAPLGVKFPTPPGEIGFADAVTHSFRHYFVSEAFMAGATEGEVMAWVGHRDSRIVRKYRHVRPANARTVVPKIPLMTDTTALAAVTEGSITMT